MFSHTVEYVLRIVMHLADKLRSSRTTGPSALAMVVSKAYLSKSIQGVSETVRLILILKPACDSLVERGSVVGPWFKSASTIQITGVAKLTVGL